MRGTMFAFAGINGGPLIVGRTVTDYNYAIPSCAGRPVTPNRGKRVDIACGNGNVFPNRFGGDVAIHAGNGMRVSHVCVRNIVGRGGWT